MPVKITIMIEILIASKYNLKTTNLTCKGFYSDIHLLILKYLILIFWVQLFYNTTTREIKSEFFEFFFKSN